MRVRLLPRVPSFWTLTVSSSISDSMTPGVFLALPAFGNMIHVNCMASLLRLILTLKEAEMNYHFGALGVPDLVEARNALLTIWYDAMPSMTHMLFIDADMTYIPDLVMDMLRFNRPVVGCMYPKKALNREFVGKPFRSETHEYIEGFIRVKAVGTGLLLIRRDAIDRMIEPSVIDKVGLENSSVNGLLKQYGVTRVLRLFDNLHTQDGRLSEDYSFCHRWQEADGGNHGLWAAVNYNIGHIGHHEYSGRYADYFEVKANDGPIAANA